MTEILIQQFFERIDNLTINSKASFGKMNVNQMVCHCTDFFKMVNGTKKANAYGKINPMEATELAKSGKTVPTPDGFGQVEGDGTQPVDLDSDKKILKEHILEFSKFSEKYEFAKHPIFGDMDYKRWNGLSIYHLNHHLEQFGV